MLLERTFHVLDFKTAAVAAAGVAVGVLTLRAVRRRRTEPKDEARSSVEAAIEEAAEALEHALAAAGHARDAGERGAGYAREEFGADVERVSVEPEGRLRRVRRVRESLADRER
jgi:hypothetical protein